MPEGDTVHRAAREQHAALAGASLVATDFRIPAFATLDLAGETVDEVVAVGKHLFHRIGARTIHSHLKMEGAWRVHRRTARGAPFARWSRPAFQARVVLETADAQSVGFELGVLEVLPRDDDRRAVAHLGPDLLGPGWDAASAGEATRRLERRPEVPVFVAVLDQRNLAGVGNVYANELCFLRGVLPTHPVGDTDAAALVDLARRLLVANRDRSTRSTTGDLRRGRTTWVYGRAGRPCLRCGTTLRGGRLGPELAPGAPDRDRAVTWCPVCQR